jgi:nicotinate phosphoribosyltransferase
LPKEQKDIFALSELARIFPDRGGLKYTKIFASGDLDEFRIAKFLSLCAPIYSFGVWTDVGTGIDAPCLFFFYHKIKSG